MTAKGVPEDYHSVTPYLIVPGVTPLIMFLQDSFLAEITRSPIRRPDDSVMHAEMRIGDSRVMMAEPTVEWSTMPGSVYLYVEDCDSTFRRALRAGAKTVMEPADQDYGDRMGGVRDPSGNLWWIAQRK
jgi:PhnB protein